MVAIHTEAVSNTREFCFPKLNVYIQVVGAAGDVPRLDARVPANLFANQFNDADWTSVSHPDLSPNERASRRHSIRNRLQIAGFSLEVLHRQAEEGDLDLLQTLDWVIESLTELEACC